MNKGYALILYSAGVDHRGAVVAKGDNKILGVFATKEGAEEAMKCLAKGYYSKLWITPVPRTTTLNNFISEWDGCLTDYGKIKLYGREKIMKDKLRELDPELQKYLKEKGVNL